MVISPGYGAGWSTWERGDAARLCLFDRRFVEAAEAGVTDIEAIAQDVTGEHIYCGGWEGIEVQWLPVGTAFTVDEYAGAESLRLIYDSFYVA